MNIVEKIVSPAGYIKVTISSDWGEIDKISKWCLDHQCGKQVALRQFAIKKEEDLTMFQLRWT